MDFENLDNQLPEDGRPSRERKLTKKGRLFALESKRKERKSCSRKQTALSDRISPKLVSDADVSAVRAEHASW
jgi:hypothetical protein